MPVKITYFVHGTTVDNENHKSSGWNDVELSDLGVQQSKDLAALTESLSSIINAMNNKVLTLNPDSSKKGVNIDKDKYDFIRSEILKVLQDKGPLGAMQLVKELDDRIGDEKFGASVGWYVTAIRLDMEAKKEVLYNRSDKKPLITLP